MRTGLAVAMPYDRLVPLFADDAFYYLEIARNISHGKGSTFDGINLTNGYHPLWEAILVPVAGVSNNRSSLVIVTALAAILFAVTGFLIDRIGQVSSQKSALTVVAACPFLLMASLGSSYFSGMESAVLITSVFALALFFVKTDAMRSATLSSRDAAVFGTLMSLVLLSRLDSVIPLAVLSVVVVATWWKRSDRISLFIPAFGIPALVAIAYLGVNLAYFGTAAPVSGQAKALGGAHGVNDGLFWQLLKSPEISQKGSMLGLLATIVVLVSLGKRMTPAARFGAIVMLGGYLTVAYYSLTSSWPMWFWYFWAAPVAFTLSFPSAFVRVFGDVRPVVLTVLRSGAILTLIAMFGLFCRQSIATSSASKGPYAWAQRVAQQVATEAPDIAPLAMGDRAGAFGYHLDRPLINIEGIVASPEFLDALANGHAPEFLRKEGVRYYANATADASTPATSAGPTCRRFMEPFQGEGPKFPVIVCDCDLVVNQGVGDGVSFRVWRYRPDLNR
ncbi:hypothetical protein [Mycolicibacterium sp. CBMA 226]|uniref:hypothetical protein n=1 Tax=Mycolicibacterium sp. CBMA 226 TaxID=2606611 RepID=UPI0012DC7104|nr:hypothetical protein [Mycolicibacterium sp. CBMA 226]MUL78119.1 hypothetical protein [Mycolicibacterium sp. CBMA 226]